MMKKEEMWKKRCRHGQEIIFIVVIIEFNGFREIYKKITLILGRGTEHEPNYNLTRN